LTTHTTIKSFNNYFKKITQIPTILGIFLLESWQLASFQLLSQVTITKEIPTRDLTVVRAML